MRLGVTGSGESDLPEPGIYRAQIAKIEADKSTYNGEERAQWKLTWKLLNYADGEPITDGRELLQWVSQSLHPKSRMYAIISGIWGQAPEPGEEITSDDILNRPAMISVIEYQKAKGGVGVKVDSVTPARRRSATPPPTAPATDEAAETPPLVAAGAGRARGLDL